MGRPCAVGAEMTSAAEMTTETGSEVKKTSFLFHIRVFLEASVDSLWCTDNLAGTSPGTRSA